MAHCKMIKCLPGHSFNSQCGLIFTPLGTIIETVNVYISDADSADTDGKAKHQGSELEKLSHLGVRRRKRGIGQIVKDSNDTVSEVSEELGISKKR